MTKHQILVEFAKERYENPTAIWLYDNNTISNIAKSTTIFDAKDFINLSKEQVKDVLSKTCKKRKTLKTKIYKLGILVETYKHITVNYLKESSKGLVKTPTILHISTTAKNLLASFGNKMEVSRVLKDAQRVGLLFKTVDRYFFNSKRNISKEYAYNKHAEQIIKELVIENELEDKVSEGYKKQIYISLGNKSSDDEPETQIYKDFKKNIRFHSKLHLPGALTDYEVIKALKENYKAAFDYVLPKIEKINRYYLEIGAPERCIKFQPTITRSKHYITKIGIRATSKIVSLKEHENGNETYTGKWRRDYLNETGYNKSSYDVHGSIFQTAHLLFTGNPVTNKIDPYLEMFHYETPDERKWLKSLGMPAYFDRPNSIINHNRGRIEKCLAKYEKYGLQPIINDVCDDVYKFTGPSLDSEIFLWESMLHIGVVERLLESNISCVQIYDGFYFNKEVREDTIESYLEEEGERIRHIYHQVTKVEKQSLKNKQQQQINPRKEKTMKNKPKFDNSDIPEEDEQEKEQNLEVLPFKKQNGWKKTTLTFKGKDEQDNLVFTDDENRDVSVSWKKIDKDRCNHLNTYKNLVKILKDKDVNIKWHIKWFDVPSSKNIEVSEILNDEQFKEYQKAAWQTKKLWRNGFQTANMFTA